MLGPFEVRVDGGAPLALGGLRQRALLAVLALHANEVVSTDRLMDELWGEKPPAKAVHTVQVFVSRIRRILGAAGQRLATRPPGYVLELGVDDFDTGRFERIYIAGRGALNSGNAAGPPPCWARPRDSGGVLRLPTSCTSRSPRQRSPGSRSCAWGAARTSSKLDAARPSRSRDP